MFPAALVVSLVLHASVAQVLPAPAARPRTAADRSIAVSLVRLSSDAWAARLAPGPPRVPPAAAGARTVGRAVGRIRPVAAPAIVAAAATGSTRVPEREALPGEPTRSVAGDDAVHGTAAPTVAAPPGGSGGTRGADGAGDPAARPQPARPADLTAVRRGILGTLRYPDEARRARLQGRVEVEFVLLADGCVREMAVRSSSGHGILDGAAVSAIEAAAPFDPPGVDVVVVLPVSFRGD